MESDFDIPEWTLGDRLRKAREYRNITVLEMAADIERSERTIRNYETDRTQVHWLVVRRYAERTHIPMTWFLTGRPPQGVPPGTPASECYPGLRVA